MTNGTSGEVLIPTGRVAKIFGVEPRAVRTWDHFRKLTIRRTPGGHRRYVEHEVYALAAELTVPAEAVAS